MKKGFTLIELLVVISIIGVLVGLTLTGFTAFRKNANDVQRRSDLAQYKAGLESYFANENGKYPTIFWGGDSYNSSGIFRTTGGPIINGYLPAEIDDPVNTATYRYLYYGVASGLSYRLTAVLETGGYWVLCSSGFAGKRITNDCLY